MGVKVGRRETMAWVMERRMKKSTRVSSRNDTRRKRRNKMGTTNG